MRLTSAIITLICLITPASALADPTGKFDVRGINADGSGEYTGTVRVTRTGETYKVVWSIGDHELAGIGVGVKLIDGHIVLGPASQDDNGISIAYDSDGTPGTVVYFERPDGTWHGIWAYQGSERIATEDWFPRDRRKVAKLKTEPTTEIRSLEPKQSLSTPMPAMAGPKS